MLSNEWSNLASVVFTRTYARPKPNGFLESYKDTVERVITGNVRGHNVSEGEIRKLRYYLSERKAGPAGRGLWYSGTASHERLGGAALVNCWALTSEDWQNYVIAQDLLMLGGGVGMSVEHRFTSKLPRVKKGVSVVHKATKDADYIVPDSREGWCKLLYRTLEAFFVTGKSFTYSTICVRGYGEVIHGFGGTASGPIPLIEMIEKIGALLTTREGRSIRPIDAADLLCCIAEMVVAGNVRRSALIILGDPWDKDYLKAKRWDLGTLPTQRAMANFSVVCDDVDDLHPLFWKSYEIGEPFGLVNRTNIQKYGRMGELKKDTAYLVNPCGEACLENAEPCNLQELALPRFDNVDELVDAARLMHRWGKRVTMETYHQPDCDEVIKRNRRIGTGITGCLQSDLFTPAVLDKVYAAIQEENVRYSKELGIPPSIRTTVVKPSGSWSKTFDVGGEGIHAGWSRYQIQRVRIGANDPLVPRLKAAGHHMEPVIKFDGSIDAKTLVVDFYIKAPDSLPTADEGWDTWKQLDVLKMAQTHWADQAVSVTVYYKREEIPQVKEWLRNNLKEIKTVSFLCYSDHGFRQAPKERITKDEYEKLSSKIKPLDLSGITEVGDLIEDADCASGACPIR